jgi:hypothetical protein
MVPNRVAGLWAIAGSLRAETVSLPIWGAPPESEFEALLVPAFGHEVSIDAVQCLLVPRSSEYPAFRRDTGPWDVRDYG